MSVHNYDVGGNPARRGSQGASLIARLWDVQSDVVVPAKAGWARGYGIGASGGNYSNGSAPHGGLGAYARGRFAVSPGETLSIDYPSSRTLPAQIRRGGLALLRAAGGANATSGQAGAAGAVADCVGDVVGDRGLEYVSPIEIGISRVIVDNASLECLYGVPPNYQGQGPNFTKGILVLEFYSGDPGVL